MANVWRLVRGYLFRENRGALKSLLWIAPLVVLWALVPHPQAAGWFTDVIRDVAAGAVFGGAFFRSPEVVGRPVSRRQVWRTQWLLATFGMTSLVFVVRLVVLASHGAIDGSLLAESTLVDLFGCTLAGGLAAMLVSPDRPLAIRTLLGLVLLIAVILAVGPGAGVWSSYLRTLLAGGLTSPAFISLSALTLALLLTGLRAVPRSVATLRRIPLQADPAETTEQGANRADVSRVSLGTDDARGGDRWVSSKLRSAALVGAGAVLCTAILHSFFPTDAPLTFLQELGGQYIEGGEITRVSTAMAAAIWVLSVADNLRLVRLLPISRVTVAATLTAGLVASLSVSFVLQAAAYRAGFGFWPPTLQIPATIAIACAVAALKSLRLFASRGLWMMCCAVAIMPGCEIVADQGAHVPVVPAAALGLFAILLLFRLDLALLTRSTHLYRVNQTLA